MPRTIVRKSTVLSRDATGAPASDEKDQFLSKLAKYIPAEINAVFVFAYGIMNSVADLPLIAYWLVFIALAILAPLYLWYVALRENTTPDKAQIIISPFAFVIWVLAIGGPFVFYSWYNQAYGAVILGIATVAIPIVDFLITKQSK